MNPEINKYLNKLKIDPENQNRILDYLSIVENLTKENIDEIFISDYLIGESREFKNLFFFSEHFFVECKKFLQSDEFNIYKLDHLVSRITLTVKSFDFTEVNNKSRFHLEILTNKKESIELKATGNNCSSLYRIHQKYILTHFSP